MNKSAVQEEFLGRLENGEEEAWRMLYDRYYELLCTTAYPYVTDHFLSESFANDILSRFWEQRERIVIHTSLKDYLVRSVINTCINHLNREKRYFSWDDLSVKSSSAGHLSMYDRDEEHPLNRLISKELEESYRKALTSLPDQCREVFRLSRMEELGYKEIADRLHISVNTVKYHIKNALAKLRELL
jgi:RNA polymerase sigma-70 factor (ECF subfamily)